MNTLNKMFSLLSPRERKLAYLFLILTILNAFVELVGIASILPFISVVADTGIIQRNKWLHWSYSVLGFSSTNHYLIFLGIIVLAILIIGNSFKAFTNWFEFRFIYLLNFSISRKILAGYLQQPYPFFINRNTADLGKNILTEVSSVIVGLFKPVLDIISRSILALVILSLLVAVNPLISLSIVLVLGGAYLLIYALFRRRISDTGALRLEANKNRFKATSEAFGGIKELKVVGREHYFLDEFSIHARNLADTQASNQLINELPRLALEVIAFGGIVVIVLFILIVQSNAGQVIPVISLYAFAGYRLFPALQLIYGSATKIRFNAPSLDVLYRDYIDTPEYRTQLEPGKARAEAMPFDREFRIEGVSYRYPEAEECVIKGLSMVIPVKSNVGLVGPTGSGKTTLVDIILGLLVPQEGKLFVDGVLLDLKNLKQWQMKLGYVPQNIFLYDETVVRNIAFGIPDRDIDLHAVEMAAKAANIHDFIVHDLPEGYNTVVGERGVRLSGGQRQRIGIARALYHNPEVVILDEATSALDGITEDAVIKAIHNLSRKKTVIKIAHRLSTVKDCDIVYVIQDGTIIAQGKYDDLMDTCAEFQSMAKAVEAINKVS